GARPGIRRATSRPASPWRRTRPATAPSNSASSATGPRNSRPLRRRRGRTTEVGMSSGNCAGKPRARPIPLPVLGPGPRPPAPPARPGRRRALVLLAVHLLIVAHVAHFVLRGETLSPVEPSETMYTLELGYVNAGFLFFVAAGLVTLVFGRFVCGWACHL